MEPEHINAKECPTRPAAPTQSRAHERSRGRAIGIGRTSRRGRSPHRTRSNPGERRLPDRTYSNPVPPRRALVGSTEGARSEPSATAPTSVSPAALGVIHEEPDEPPDNGRAADTDTAATPPTYAGAMRTALAAAEGSTARTAQVRSDQEGSDATQAPGGTKREGGRLDAPRPRSVPRPENTGQRPSGERHDPEAAETPPSRTLDSTTSGKERTCLWIAQADSQPLEAGAATDQIQHSGGAPKRRRETTVPSRPVTPTH